MTDVVTTHEQTILTVAENNVLIDRQEVLVIAEVAQQGPPGPRGIPGPAEQRKAGETLSALRAVYEADGAVYLLDPAVETQALAFLGITITAAAEGEDITVQTMARWTTTAGLGRAAWYSWARPAP